MRSKTRLRKDIAMKKGCSWSLMAAMIDPHLDVYRCTRLGETDYFCDEELAAQPDPKQWVKGAKVTMPGKPLRISGKEAEEYRLANHVVRRLSGIPADLRPGKRSHARRAGLGRYARSTA